MKRSTSLTARRLQISVSPARSECKNRTPQPLRIESYENAGAALPDFPRAYRNQAGACLQALPPVVLVWASGVDHLAFCSFRDVAVEESTLDLALFPSRPTLGLGHLGRETAKPSCVVLAVACHRTLRHRRVAGASVTRGLEEGRWLGPFDMAWVRWLGTETGFGSMVIERVTDMGTDSGLHNFFLAEYEAGHRDFVSPCPGLFPILVSAGPRMRA